MVDVNAMARVLILGGTTEARLLAERLAERVGPADVEIVSSLAGRVASPRMPPGHVRVGGFGGATGLAAWIGAHGIRAVIDATHPFAATISRNAAIAAAASHVPLLALRRAPWIPGEGDRWHQAASLDEAALMLPDLGRRHFLTIGRQGVSAFCNVADAWFLVRAIDPPQGRVPPRMELLLDRGPYDLDAEVALMRDRRVDTLVTKNSGGNATRAKLTAARQIGLPVVMVQRPSPPENVQMAPDVSSACEWVDSQLR